VAIERSLSAFAIPFADGEPEDVGERFLLDNYVRVVWILGAAHGSMLSLTRKIEGPPRPSKRFCVKRDAHGSDILASFDTLEEAISSVRRRRGDRRYVILDARKIVWPESRAKVE
jgi:hypothetical protein